MLRTDFLFWLMMTAIPHVMIGYAGASSMLARLDDAERSWLLGLMQTMLPISCRRAGILNDLVENARFDRGLLSRISVPTLIIHALDDPLVPFADGEYAARAIAGAQLIVLEDGGHFGLAGDRAKFDLMVAFIRQHARSSV
jgi:pimeloyl-ACP methyl ester carboxylesterase